MLLLKNSNFINEAKESYKSIQDSYRYLANYSSEHKDIITAGDWLLDNIYLIQKAFNISVEGLSKKYLKSILGKDDHKNVIEYSREYINEFSTRQNRERNEEESIVKFLKDKDEKKYISIGELWAFPMVISFQIIINLKSIVEKICTITKDSYEGREKVQSIINHKEKDEISDELLEDWQEKSSSYVNAALDYIKNNIISTSDVYEKLKSQTNIELDSVIIEEKNEEADLTRNISDYISLLRFLNNIDWKKVFDKSSRVENILMQDPCGVYSKMDYRSKDYYRKAIERLSRKYNIEEYKIVENALKLSSVSSSTGDNNYKTHIGYYIVDKGLTRLKTDFDIKDKGMNEKTKEVLFICSNILLTVIISLIIAFTAGFESIVQILLLLIPCSEISNGIINWSISKLKEPEFVPKMNLEEGVADECRTVVVVPVIVDCAKKLKKYVDNIETYYISNKDKNVFFAVLCDFADSKNEHEKSDDEICSYGISLVKNLNEKYGFKNDKFFFLCRKRIFNVADNLYMGWERKRGKLVEFMELLRGKNDTSYNVFSGDIEKIKSSKYIITLDADTVLPMGTAAKVIGAMSHPLNKAYIDKENKVIRGYGIMQPRVSISVESMNKTYFSKIFSMDGGLDIYTTAASDTYEDLFSEGSFTGKGIIDIDTFMTVIKDEIPENLVLSHDLLEGLYARCALLSDVELIDSYPSHYDSNTARLERWVRGDWQIISWMINSRISILGKWKIFDNLRRSLIAPTIIIGIFANLLFWKNTTLWTTAFILQAFLIVLFTVTDFVVTPMKNKKIQIRNFEQVLLILSFLPNQCVLMIKAISKTLYRMIISKKHLLEWTTAENAEKKSGNTLLHYVKKQWVSSVIGFLFIYLNFKINFTFGLSNIPIGILWVLNPYICYSISKERRKISFNFSSEDNAILHEIARRTWCYYDNFVNDENNYLAPDNYQEEPNNGIAYRTSPTNIGLSLLSAVSAYDIGYINVIELINHVSHIINSTRKLEKYKGLLFNWYDTRSMVPLYPRYVSSVDCGNFIGYIMVLKKSLEDAVKNPVFRIKEASSLTDIIKLAGSEIDDDSYYEEEINNLNNNEITVEYFREILKGIIKKAQLIVEKDSEKEMFYHKQLIKESCLKLELISSYDDSIMNKPLLNSEDTYVEVIKKYNKCLKDIEKILNETDLRILYDKERKLFYIGINVENGEKSEGYYDFLASESRITSFLAIIRGDVDYTHWFKLSRAKGKIFGSKVLSSWSGTMFEYFMPSLIMKSYEDTLLDNTYKSVVNAQIKYAEKHNVPWGISESAYYLFDSAYNYQYKAFGVPGLGLKRGLEDELVVSPYSTVISMEYDIRRGIDNLKRLMRRGLLGKYGFFDAIDFTKGRMVRNKQSMIIKNYMVHHNGMVMMALDNIINNDVFKKRFHSISEVKAYEILLKEKDIHNYVYDRESVPMDLGLHYVEEKLIKREVLRKNEVNLLSNGSYTVMTTGFGSGVSKKDSMTVNRWREDPSIQKGGIFIYIKNLNSNEFWSCSYEPCKIKGDSQEVSFSEDMSCYKRTVGNIETSEKIIVSSEDDGEIRRITVKNNSSSIRTIEVTSYMEVTLAPYKTDYLHPAFSNLFIATEYDEESSTILAMRRPRAKGQNKPYVAQSVFIEGKQTGSISYETDREKFVGRDRNLKYPRAMDNDSSLQNSIGTVLDPILSMRVRLEIKPHEESSVSYIIMTANSRKDAVLLSNKYKNADVIRNAFMESRKSAKDFLKEEGIKSETANIYCSLADNIIYGNRLEKNKVNISSYKGNIRNLWSFGISGDLPIMLLVISSIKDTDVLRSVITMHRYWNKKGLNCDFVIYDDEESSYDMNLKNSIVDTVNSTPSRDMWNKPSGIYVVTKSAGSDSLTFLKAMAKFIICDKSVFNINQTVDKNENDELCVFDLKNNNLYTDSIFNKDELDIFNGYGGFRKNTGSYVIILNNKNVTPAPWINVLSNENFGCIVTESGGGYTWAYNSREFKLTPWTNDWIIDGSDEALYLRDDDRGEIFSIMSKPIRDDGEYVIEHCFGYTEYSHRYNNINGKVRVFVPHDEKMKVLIVNLQNLGESTAHISLSYYAQIVMGTAYEENNNFIYTDINKENGYIFASNIATPFWNDEKMYLSILNGDNKSFTGDRMEFIGDEGDIAYPKAMKFKNLNGKSGFNDPCLSEMCSVEIESGEEKQLFIILGIENSIEEINSKLLRYKNSDINKILDKTTDWWDKFLHKIQIKTPEKSMDYMINGWLMYQTAACRYYGRSAFYQSGGAFGFRDQLQDSLALSILDENITRKQILLSCSRQYEEGDVQHWYHPVINSGIRTRFSDDLLWLPYVLSKYIFRSGDYDILDEKVCYIKDTLLSEGEDERYTENYNPSYEDTVYNHALKAIKKSLKFGDHNIPLMGCGDWNDGMNTVGNKGKGESVWLGWFLIDILRDFKVLAQYKRDDETVKLMENSRNFIIENIEKNAWDGGWYRRAYFDDGIPLGSRDNDECTIDSLSQSWSVISEGGRKARTEEAMNSLANNLVREDIGIIRLLAPSFKNSSLEPGYIKGYLEGVRENGGQYTHAAVWVILAQTKMGNGDTAEKYYRMINPISHSATRILANKYKVEPYVICADVYNNDQHEGRGGWSWYTGASGWFYKVGIENILGYKKINGEGFSIKPCIPSSWDEYYIKVNEKSCIYNIHVVRGKEAKIILDDEEIQGDIINFKKGEHNLTFMIKKQNTGHN